MVVFPSSLRWNSNNTIYVTPNSNEKTYVDIVITINRDLTNNKIPLLVITKNNCSASKNFKKNFCFLYFLVKTTKIVFELASNAYAKKYVIQVKVNDFTHYNTINGGPNIKWIHIQTNKVFYKPSENGTIFFY